MKAFKSYFQKRKTMIMQTLRDAVTLAPLNTEKLI